MTIREGQADELLDLWREFCAESPPPAYVTDAEDGARADIDRAVRDGLALVADGGAGFVFGFLRPPGLAVLSDLWVRPDSRHRGLGTALVDRFFAAARERGAEAVRVEVGVGNRAARALYRRFGFREETVRLAAELVQERPAGRSFGSIHVQTDDIAAVERAVRQFVPRLAGARVAPPRDGWIRVEDELADREPKLLTLLARELSDRMGAVVLALGVEEAAVVRFSLFERGRLMDEYLSVQEYYGPLPPGDVIGLAANPTVVARLTGAEPAAVRAAALHAARPEDLPPPEEILGGLARAIGVEVELR